jgi:peptidyl-prolyl cis-trans isomerase C
MKYHVAHILLTHQYEAEDVFKKLKEGKNFNELAQKYSTCPSASKGGDLGPLAKGKADPDFEEAALGLQVGEISKAPIRTRFGYHLIKRLG